MAVIEIKEDWTVLSCEVTGAGLTAKRRFSVKFDSGTGPVYRPLAARSASDGVTTIPAIYESHPNNDGLFCGKKTVTPTDSPFVFDVLVSYEWTGIDGTDPENPLQKAPVYSFYYSRTNEKIDRDIYNNAISNSSGETFDPPIMKEFYDLIMRIVVNRALNEYTPAMASEKIGTINQGSFEGFNAETVLCTAYGADEVRGPDDLKYWTVTMEFQIRTGGWKRRILDEGFRVISGSNILADSTDTKQIVDQDRKPISEPALLNGNGGLATEAIPVAFKQFEIYEKTSFSGLV